MEQRLRLFENRMLRKIFWLEREEVNRESRRLYKEESYDLYSSPNVIWVTKSRKMRRRDTWHILEIKELQTVESLADRDHLEDVGLYGRITLNSIFRLIQIIHIAPGEKSGKK
jgi:hypothetical protein